MASQLLTANLDEAPRCMVWSLKAGRPVLFVGSKGTGKTRMVQDFVVKARIGFPDFGLFIDIKSQQDAVDARGVPFPQEESGVTEWYLPNRVPFEGNALVPEAGIWFLDEVDTADPSVMNTLTPLILDRELDGRKIKEGWSFVLAMNGSTDINTEPLRDALLNRLTVIYVYEPRMSRVADYGESRGWNERTLRVARTSTVFRSKKPDFDDLQAASEPAPRDVERISDIENALDEGLPFETTDVLPLMIQGVIGFPRMLEYITIRSNRGLPTIDEIERDPRGATLPTERSDLMAVAANISRKPFTTGDEVRSIEQRCIYVRRIGSIGAREIETFAMRSMLARDGRVVHCQQYTDWFKKKNG